ncbi:MAG: PhoH family protein [Chitinispirillaceae bacterium]
MLESLLKADKTAAYGNIPRNAEQTFALDALMNDDIRVVTVSGKAGTGKTFPALAAALNLRNWPAIFLRSAIPVSALQAPSSFC